jgi:hypothetical protein
MENYMNNGIVYAISAMSALADTWPMFMPMTNHGSMSHPINNNGKVSLKYSARLNAHYLPKAKGYLRILSDGTTYRVTPKGWVKQ